LLKTSATHHLVLLAIACFDKCHTQFFRIQLARDTKKASKGSVIAVQHTQKIESMHKVPLGGLRLSRAEARYLVTSGDEFDVSLCLWDLQSKERLWRVETSQIKHKPRLASSADYDIFSVAA
jgi:hypothetical protein